MAGGSESRRSMASASVAAHRAEANVADARLARYNDRIGRVRKERPCGPVPPSSWRRCFCSCF